MADTEEHKLLSEDVLRGIDEFFEDPHTAYAMLGLHSDAWFGDIDMSTASTTEKVRHLISWLEEGIVLHCDQKYELGEAEYEWLRGQVCAYMQILGQIYNAFPEAF